MGITAKFLVSLNEETGGSKGGRGFGVDDEGNNVRERNNF